MNPTKGVLFKYEANPMSPELRDCRDEEICGITDPDFWTNEKRGTFVWSVCGPYVRSRLQVGDILFFLPMLSSLEKAGFGDYVCTGVLIVEELIDEHMIREYPSIVEVYKRQYAADLRKHRNSPRESERTKRIRGKNIVIGHPPRSIWFGRRGPILKDILPKGTLGPEDLRKMRIPYIRDPSKVRELYRRIVGTDYDSLIRKL